MGQIEYKGLDSIQYVSKILNDINAKNIFIVCGNKSYKLSGAENFFKTISDQFDKIVIFSDFENNPKYENLIKGIKLFKENEFDLIIGIGGGSSIDMAKLISILSIQPGNTLDYIKKEGDYKFEIRPIDILAIPTTIGSGSEATDFAVIYIDNKKYSVQSEWILPKYVILDPKLTLSLPKKIAATSGFDALSHAVESFWSINSTIKSRNYAEKSIKIILSNYIDSVNSPSLENRENMLYAANLSGKAIKITKTTAPHALSYFLTSNYGIEHGQAVALTLGEFFIFNTEISEKDCQNKRGYLFVKKQIERLMNAFKCNSTGVFKEKITKMMLNVGLKIRLSDFGINRADVIEIVKNVNLERLKNNPRIVSQNDIIRILNSIY